MSSSSISSTVHKRPSTISHSTDSSSDNTRRKKGRRISPNSKLLCEICNQAYSRRDNLRVHQRMHSGETPFKCHFCGQRFRWVGAFRIHEKNHIRDGHTVPQQHTSIERARALKGSTPSRKKSRSSSFAKDRRDSAAGKRKQGDKSTRARNTGLEMSVGANGMDFRSDSQLFPHLFSPDGVEPGENPAVEMFYEPWICEGDDM